MALRELCNFLFQSLRTEMLEIFWWWFSFSSHCILTCAYTFSNVLSLKTVLKIYKRHLWRGFWGKDKPLKRESKHSFSQHLQHQPQCSQGITLSYAPSLPPCPYTPPSFPQACSIAQNLPSFYKNTQQKEWFLHERSGQWFLWPCFSAHITSITFSPLSSSRPMSHHLTSPHVNLISVLSIWLSNFLWCVRVHRH